jgi:hypothetical protein
MSQLAIKRSCLLANKLLCKSMAVKTQPVAIALLILLYTATAEAGDGCGNNIAELPEVCDGSDLAGESCVSLLGLGTAGSLACNLGCDGFDTSGCIPPVCVTPPANLTHWWPGNGNANDIIGGMDGQLVGGTAFAAAAVDQGFIFDSNDDRVSLGSNAGFNISTPGFTVDFWMKGLKTQTGSLFDVVDKSHGFVDSTGWTFQGHRTSGELSFAVGLGGPGVLDFGVITSADVLDGDFHHIAGVWDGSDNSITLYVDGALQASMTLPSIPVNNSRPLHLAYSWGGGAPQRFFSGSIDELEIFRRALSAAEIQSIFNAGAAGKCEPPCGVVGAIPPTGDLTSDCRVNLLDFAVIATGFPATYSMSDVLDIVGNWLSCSGPSCP